MKNKGYLQGLEATAQMSMYLTRILQEQGDAGADFEEGFMEGIEEWVNFIKTEKGKQRGLLN